MDAICPPLRWNIVEVGISRGGYPLLRNFRHLSRMRLKTIVSLIPEPQSADLVEFAKMAGIELIYIQTNRTGPMAANLQQCLVQAVNVCLNVDKHPVYIHCLDGRRISGLVVLFLRRLQGWTPFSAVAEYWRFQTTMRPAVPSLEIERTSRDLEKFALEFGDIIVTDKIPRWLWGGNRNTVVIGIKLKYIPPLISYEGDLTMVLGGGSTSAEKKTQRRMSFEDDDDRPAGLGPGAIKALQLLRNHTNISLHKNDKIRSRSSSGFNQHLPLERNSLSTSPISRTLDALCLSGLEYLSSRYNRMFVYSIIIECV
jgi:hypothetical protein